MEVEARRTRGPNKQEPWARRPEDGVSVLRLALDVHDPLQRRRIERMFEDAYRVGEPASARVDYAAANRARPEVQRLLTPYLPLGWQDTRSVQLWDSS